MNEDPLKEILNRHKLPVLTCDGMWPAVLPVVVDLMNAAPLHRLSQEEIDQINGGRFDSEAFSAAVREALKVAQIKKSTALGEGKVNV